MSARPVPAPGAVTGTTSTRGPDDWRARATCLDHDPDLFVADDGERADRRTPRVARAQAVCRTCPVQHECLTDALRHNDGWAVRGGVDFSILTLRTIRHRRAALRAAAA